jgi:hypothetical protein
MASERGLLGAMLGALRERGYGEVSPCPLPWQDNWCKGTAGFKRERVLAGLGNGVCPLGMLHHVLPW